MKSQECNSTGKPRESGLALEIDYCVSVVRELWLIPVLLLATLVRLYGSTASAIWCDEGSSLLMSDYSPSLIWSHSAHDVHPPLYFLLLHGWIGLFGDSLFSVRFLSVLPGIVTVALGVWLVYLTATRRAAVLAGVLLALLPIAVRYSQEVRMYSLMGLWLLGATIALVYWVKNPDRQRYLVVYVVLMTASFYTHYFTCLCVLSHWCYLLLVGGQTNRLVLRPAWWVANSLIVLMYVPWMPGLIDLLQHLDLLKVGGDIGWIPPITLDSLPSAVWQYLTLTDGRDFSWPVYFSLPLAVLLLTGVMVWLDRGPHKFHLLLAIYTLLPLIVIFLVSWKTPLLIERYLMFSALGLPLILAIVVDRISVRFRYLAMVIFTALLLVEAGGLINDYHADDDKFDVLVNHVNDNYMANDRIVVSDMFWYLGYVYYNRTGSAPRLYTPPLASGASGRPNNYGFGTLVDNDSIYLDSLDQLKPGPGRVWLISGSEPPDDFSSIPGNWTEMESFKMGAVMARLYATPAAP